MFKIEENKFELIPKSNLKRKKDLNMSQLIYIIILSQEVKIKTSDLGENINIECGNNINTKRTRDFIPNQSRI